MEIKLVKDIKASRRAAGMSQEALALQADVDRSYVSKFERGITNPIAFRPNPTGKRAWVRSVRVFEKDRNPDCLIKGSGDQITVCLPRT